MKKRILLISLMSMILISGVVFAKQATETIDVLYNNIKIIIDGEEFIAKDVNGNVVEPFIYNGTTYLPVRGIANAFNKNVGWNPETMTVTLGSQEYDYLNKLSYIDNQQESCNNATFSLADNGIQMYQSGGGVWHEYDGYPTQNVAYQLNGKYTSFKALVRNTESNGAGAKINFYGDNKKRLYSVPAISSESDELEIDISVEGQNILYIEVENVDYYEANIIFKNARLLKK